MKRQLLNGFLTRSVWLVAFVLSVINAVAGALPADTCQVPSPPVITGSAKAICRGESVMLSATGCAGTVIWSNGQTGGQISVQPQQTTRYTAICRLRPGCISCFADVWMVTVSTPAPPVLSASTTLVCPGDNVTLTAARCGGTIRWSDGATGPSLTVKLTESTVYRATCEQQGCVSNPSETAAVQVALPTKPIILIDKPAICAGQSVRLTAGNCTGLVRWSDGGTGRVRTATPYQTTTYRAVCVIGSCQSDSSTTVPVAVRPSGQRIEVVNTLTNGCPFQTADLTRALPNGSDLPMLYAFRTGPSPDAPAVQSPTAVRAGTYYVQGRDAGGCYTEAAAVTVRINACANAIAPCLSDPATVAVWLDSLDWTTGIVRVRGLLGGSAERATWQSSGNGLFADAGVVTRYLVSDTDRQRGSALLTLTVPDPDGSGPCVGASAQLAVTAPVVASPERIGLSKEVAEPVWVVDGGRQLVQLMYRLTVANAGPNTLRQIRVIDDLEKAFTSTGAQLHSVSVRADGGLIANPAYTGRGADTTMLMGEASLPVNATAHVDLTVRLDVSQAQALTFVNQATAQALDANGTLCRDRSTNGTDVDPDRNGDPGDNYEPTRVTLRARQPDAGEDVFIPEGFSPNGDGINDRFVIQRLPAGTTVALEVYNRWGHLVYKNGAYQNDWDGTPNEGVRTSDAKQGLPDGTYFYQIRLSDGREFARFLTIAR